MRGEGGEEGGGYDGDELMLFNQNSWAFLCDFGRPVHCGIFELGTDVHLPRRC